MAGFAFALARRTHVTDMQSFLKTYECWYSFIFILELLPETLMSSLDSSPTWTELTYDVSSHCSWSQGMRCHGRINSALWKKTLMYSLFSWSVPQVFLLKQTFDIFVDFMSCFFIRKATFSSWIRSGYFDLLVTTKLLVNIYILAWNAICGTMPSPLVSS